MSKAKIIQSAKLYLQKQGEKEMRHVTNWPTFLKVCDDLELSTAWKDRVFLNDKDFPPIGKPITEWPEGEEPPLPSKQRKMSILWMGDEKWLNDFGGTHIVGFHEPCRPDWYPPSKVKLISYLKYYSLDEIRAYVRRWKDHPNNGGYWMIEGHEPDITGGSMHEPGTVEAHKQLRIAQYQAIRAIDPDAWNHPVVIWYDCTGQFAHYPGWKGAFPTPEEGVDCDIFAADIYANRCDGTTNYEGLRKAAENLVKIGLERNPDAQFIPCLGAFVKPDCKAASLLEQWEFWVAWYLEQTGEKLKAVALYNSGEGSTCEGVYSNEKLAEEAKEINRRLGLLK